MATDKAVRKAATKSSPIAWGAPCRSSPRGNPKEPLRPLLHRRLIQLYLAIVSKAFVIPNVKSKPQRTNDAVDLAARCFDYELYDATGSNPVSWNPDEGRLMAREAFWNGSVVLLKAVAFGLAIWGLVSVDATAWPHILAGGAGLLCAAIFLFFNRGRRNVVPAITGLVVAAIAAGGVSYFIGRDVSTMGTAFGTLLVTVVLVGIVSNRGVH